MAAHTIVVLVLLGLAALIVVLSAVGLVLIADRIARLHFLAPVTSVAAPLVGAAYLVDQGFGLAGGLVLLIVALLALTGVPLGSAIARLTAEERELIREDESP